MAPPIAQLKDIIHAIACRAIRHDLKTPLAHIESYCGLIKQAMHRKPELLQSKVARPIEVIESVTEIPRLAQAIRQQITALEKSLTTSSIYSGESAQVVLKGLIDDQSAELEAKAKSLKAIFGDIDQQCAEFATRVAKNAKSARSRLDSLESFFKAEYANRSMISVNLRDHAERAARDTSPNSTIFSRVFQFSGDEEIFASESLLQNLFQNIYENTLRYGAGTPDLQSVTKFSGGAFPELANNIQIIKERPPIGSRWVRIDFSNNGPPLSPHDPNSVFQLGKRFGVAGIEDEEGQGIGMAICFAVAILHKGFIWAFKRKSGVIFSVFLPRRREDGFNDAQLLEISRRMRIV